MCTNPMSLTVSYVCIRTVKRYVITNFIHMMEWMNLDMF